MADLIDKTGRLLTADARANMGGETRFQPKHGMRHSVEYRIWQDMLNRCRNPKVRSYPRYGGRGIKVCERWKEFKNFYADMGFRPSDDHSLDREDIDGDYEPGNVRWILKSRQQANTSKSRFVEFRGKKITVTELARLTGKDRTTISKKLNRGLSVQEAIR